MDELGLIIRNCQVVVSSRRVAEVYRKRHWEVLRKIENFIESVPELAQHNFVLSEYMDVSGRMNKEYEMDRQGFSILVNKFTGEEALKFTIKYSQAFEEMTRQLREPIGDHLSSAGTWANPASEHIQFAKVLSGATGIKPGIAYAAAISEAEKEVGRDLSGYMKLLPPAEYKTAYLNPTELGEKVALNAQAVNRLLENIGLQERFIDSKGHKCWRITKNGKNYGEEFPYNRNGHSAYQVKWNENVIEALLTMGFSRTIHREITA